MAQRFQFRLRTVFWLTAWAAALCVVGPWAAKKYREHRLPLLFKIPVITHGPTPPFRRSPSAEPVPGATGARPEHEPAFQVESDAACDRVNGACDPLFALCGLFGQTPGVRTSVQCETARMPFQRSLPSSSAVLWMRGPWRVQEGVARLQKGKNKRTKHFACLHDHRPCPPGRSLNVRGLTDRSLSIWTLRFSEHQS
jgi:hypothetical protein